MSKKEKIIIKDVTDGITLYKDYNFKFDVKDDNDKHMIIEGIATPFDGKPDQGGDIIEFGAYTKTLHRKPKIKLLAFHNPDEPIGTGFPKEEKKGLMMNDSKILKTVKAGFEMSELIKDDIIDALSIGYKAVKVSFSKEGFRNLHEIMLREISPVPFPMNEGSVITDAKAEMLKLSFEEALNLAISKIDQVAPSGLELVNHAVKTFNTLLMENLSLDTSDNGASEDNKDDPEDPGKSEREEADKKKEEEAEADRRKKLIVDWGAFLQDRLLSKQK